MNVLFLGGTGTISTACVADAVGQGLNVYILNRGKTLKRPVAQGATPNIFNLTSEQIKKAYPDWFWADQIIGDLSHSAVFDNSKVRAISPRFKPTIKWADGAGRLARWYQANNSKITFDEEINSKCDELYKIYSGVNKFITTKEL